MSIMNKLETYLGDNEDINEIDDDLLINKAIDIIMDLDVDSLSEEQAEEVMSILDLLDNEEEEISEFTAKKVRIDPKKKRERKKAYRQQKSKLKRKAKKFRKSAKGKQLARKAKRMKKTGKTSTGKRIRKFR